MASDKTSQLFWLQYGDAIRQKVGVGSGDKIFFLATETQKGPLAGNNIPDAYTAQGLYNLGNNLLSTNNVFYSPSALHGYDEAIGLYLNWVELGGKSNPALGSAYLDALKNQVAYQKSFDNEQDSAHARWKKDTDYGLTDKSFKVWVESGKAPAWQAAKDRVDSISQTITNLQLQQEGPMSVTVKEDRDRLRKGKNEETDFDGYNMHAASGNVLSTAELTQKFLSGETIPEPPFHRLPLYEAGSYKQFVQDAMQKARSSDYSSPQRIDVNIDTGKTTADYNFGQTNGGANVGVSNGWFSFNAGASHSSESSTLQLGSESSQVQVAITYNDLQAITITTGAWNVDVSKYKLRSDAPKEVKSLARVSQVIVIAGLGYEIKVGASTAETLDTKLKQTTSAGGSISVFGIPIGLGGSGSSTKENQTHKTSWDKASRTFKVVPNFDNNCATVVGVVAEPFQIKA
ncbi:hypothetical protein CNYM01_02743 [Colletotrichum nymphaeae SA-01]|uniref:Uncharacterized protein n=1 Tax=Colletotrichum nymphaeae SA-01 TaxID=1460502 RepID=A0A135T634_9PEZI|nr:hypothetical protein CNYM01_02743 [Colletotrichum nymphaeae SA-01]